MCFGVHGHRALQVHGAESWYQDAYSTFHGLASVVRETRFLCDVEVGERHEYLR